jgi:hypothetical protein
MTTVDRSDAAVRSQDLADALARACAKLGRFGASYPVHLTAPAGAELVPATALLEPATMREYAARALKEWSDHPLDEDPRAAVSRLMRRYCGALAAAALIPLANGVGLDVSPERVTFIIRLDMPGGTVLDVGPEVLVTRERPTTWPVSGNDVGTVTALRDRTLEIFFRHLAATFEAVLAQVKVAPNLLWSTAAEQIDGLYENAVDGHPGEAYAPFAQDRERMLFADTIPGIPGTNPLRGLLYWETVDAPDFPRPLQVRPICCANFVVPGRPNVYCRTCGLITQEQRITMWRDWRESVRKQG